MTKPGFNLPEIISQAAAADLDSLRDFFFNDPTRPLIATGSGGADSVSDLTALLYGARCGVASAVTPLTLNSFSDDALKTSKLLLISSGGHNNDIVFAAKRGLSLIPERTASFTFSTSDRNEVRKLFLKAGSPLSFDIPSKHGHDGFVSVNTPLEYFARLCRVFDPACDLEKYARMLRNQFSVIRNDGSPLALDDLRDVKSFTILHGSWGRPVASNLEGKLVESGFAPASVSDYRNNCHGRFIFTSNHLDDSAVIMLVSPRERDIAERTRKFLPAKTLLVLIETDADAPEASFDLLVRATDFFLALCEAVGVDHFCPSNPGRIDKRVPMWIPFVAALKKAGPLALVR